MTPVRTRVARSESTPVRPIFAKMAVMAANTAESNAQKNHVVLLSIQSVSTPRFIGAVVRVGASISRLFHGGDDFCIAALSTIQPTNRNFNPKLKFHAGVSKKVGLPGFSSASASCTIEAELDSSLLQDREGFQVVVQRAYQSCEQAV